MPALTDLMLETFNEAVPSELSVLRDTFIGTGADGGYATAGFEHQLADKFHLPLEFTKEVNRWDFAHRIELVDEHARNERGNGWIDNMDQQMKAFMTAYKEYNGRLLIIRTCQQLGIDFAEFIFYSDTRFAQYRKRTYRVFLHLYPVLYK